MSKRKEAFDDFMQIKESQGTIGIRVTDCVDYIKEECTEELKEMPRAELEDRFLKFYVAVCLNERGYRSLKRGKGCYINEAECKDKELRDALERNSWEDFQEAQAKYEHIKNRTNELAMTGQLAFSGNNLETHEIEDWDAVIDKLCGKAI